MLVTGMKKDACANSLGLEGKLLFLKITIVLNFGGFRSIIKEHIPKKHLNFEEPIKHDKKFDNTHDRIHGERRDELMYTENHFYGKSKNAADDLPRKGRRTIDIEREVS